MSVALITGCSTGIGFEIALSLARAGHTVYATMRNPARSPELAAIAARDSLPIKVITLDVDQDASVNAAVEQVMKEQSRIDVLVNNAGVAAIGPIEELDLSVFQQAMETNYIGALRCIKAVLPGMRERTSGTIINVSSVAGRLAASPQGPYTASKFALEAISEVLAQEVKGFNIRVIIVEPGTIQTPIFGKGREIPSNTNYPQERRFHALNAISLARGVLPSVVGDKVRDIVESDSWQLRYAVGADARPLISWRKLQSDEDWVDKYATRDDDEWCKQMLSEFGIDLRPHLKPAPASDRGNP